MTTPPWRYSATAPTCAPPYRKQRLGPRNGPPYWNGAGRTRPPRPAWLGGATRRARQRFAPVTLIWNALDGFAPDRTTDFESLETADRLGLICGRQGRIRVTGPVHYSLRPNNHR